MNSMIINVHVLLVLVTAYSIMSLSLFAWILNNKQSGRAIQVHNFDERPFLVIMSDKISDVLQV